MQLTKIIATIKDDYEKEKIIQLSDAGVDVIRINFTHATPDTAQEIISEINKLNAEGTTHLSVLLDTKGPDIRTGVRENPLQIKKNQIFNIFVDLKKLTEDSDIFCDYP